jgi:hypothetical protein
MKIRIISFHEVESGFRDLLEELDRSPMDEELVLEKAAVLSVVLRLCISQMQAGNSASYPEKSKHLNILNAASESITYKLNTCTTEEVKMQINNAYRAFGAQQN